MLDQAIANAQRLLDRLPKPPSFYPVGSMERVLGEIVDPGCDAGMADELEETLQQLADAERELEDIGCSRDQLEELLGRCERWEEDLADAVDEARTVHLGTAEERLAQLLGVVDRVARELKKVAD